MARSRDGMFVMVDPGHGGDDPGCLHNGLVEKDLALRFSERIVQEVKDRVTLRCWMTRPDDRTASLEYRVKLANDRDADVFVSVHVNTAETEGTSGMWIIHDDQSSEGMRLANTLQRTLRAHDFKCDVVVPDGTPHVGGRQLAVLSRTKMPAVLLELGFIKNPTDRALLMGGQDSHRRVAEAVAEALEAWGAPVEGQDPLASLEARVAALEARLTALENT